MAGQVPAVLYGRGRESEALAILEKDLERAMTTATGTTIINLDVEGSTYQTLMREVQRHPIRPGVLHVDFYEIHEGETLTIDIPIHLEGVPEGVRSAGGVLDQSLREIEVEVLPRHIPDRIVVDVTNLAVGQSIHVSDLVVENATILADPHTTVCVVVPPRLEEVVEGAEAAEVEESAEPELIRKPKPEEEGAEE
jgi:large subunit ribosomal protein L25